MTQSEIDALVKAAGDGEQAELGLDPAVVAKVKAGLAARARLGSGLNAEEIYSTSDRPYPVWMLDPTTGLAVEVHPAPLSVALAKVPSLGPNAGG